MSAGAETVQVGPAASVWNDVTPQLLEERVAFFRREGFLVLRNLLSIEEVEELNREVGRIVSNHTTIEPVREGFDLEPNQDSSRGYPTFRKIGGVTSLSAAFDRLMRHDKIVPVLHALMGPVIDLYRDVVMMKLAGVGREKPWHQDSTYWPWRPMSLVSAMTALDRATPENGCLQVIPGTHTEEVQHFGQELQIEVDENLQKKSHYVPLEPGDTLLFHSLLLHASEPNRSERDRRVAIISYKTPELEYVGKGKPPPTISVHDSTGSLSSESYLLQGRA